MARASALRVNLNLQPSAPSLPRPSARTKHAHLLYALNLEELPKWVRLKKEWVQLVDMSA